MTSLRDADQDEVPPVAAPRDIRCDHSIESAHDRHDNSSYSPC
jgi:hypothetical protein